MQQRESWVPGELKARNGRMSGTKAPLSERALSRNCAEKTPALRTGGQGELVITPSRDD
jgi:hypothetical protein